MPAKKKGAKALPPAAAEPNPDFIDPWNNRLLLEYFAAVRARFGNLRVLQVSTYKEERDYHIDDLFVRPALSEWHISLSEAKDAKSLGADLLDALAEDRHLIVLGDPGSGKSTLVNWLAWSMASTESHRPVNRLLGPLVPIPVILRESAIPDHGEDSRAPRVEYIIDVFLSQRFANVLRDEGRELLRDLLRRGQLFFLFDGVDELPTTKREWLRVAWEQIARSPALGLVTSRVVGYDPRGFEYSYKETAKEAGGSAAVDQPAATYKFARHEGIATCYYTAPFDSSRMAAFARNWYRLRSGDQETAEERAREFLADVSRHAALSELRHSPLLLTFMAIVYNARNRLPDGRVLLYREIVDAFLAKISLGKKLPIEFPPEIVHEALSHVAWRAQQLRDVASDSGRKLSDGLLLPESEVCSIMSSVLAEKEGREPGEDYVRAFLENCKQ